MSNGLFLVSSTGQDATGFGFESRGSNIANVVAEQNNMEAWIKNDIKSRLCQRDTGLVGEAQ